MSISNTNTFKYFFFILLVGKFSLGSGRKKERMRIRSIPDVYARGGLVWSVQVIASLQTCLYHLYSCMVLKDFESLW